MYCKVSIIEMILISNFFYCSVLQPTLPKPLLALKVKATLELQEEVSVSKLLFFYLLVCVFITVLDSNRIIRINIVFG